MPDSYKTLFLGVTLRAFLEEISIWFSRLSKEICPDQYEWASSNPLRTQIEQKAKEGWILSFLELECPWTSELTLGHQSSRFLGLCTLETLAVTPDSKTFSLGLGIIPLATLILKSLNLDWLISLAFLVLWLADSGLWDFLSLHHYVS